MRVLHKSHQVSIFRWLLNLGMLSNKCDGSGDSVLASVCRLVQPNMLGSKTSVCEGRVPVPNAKLVQLTC